MSGEKGTLTRRNFLFLGWVSLATFVGGAFLGGLRYMFPNVSFEPPTKFKMGKPEDYQSGSVVFEEERRVYLFHTERGFHAISGVCTHLGCTVNRDLSTGGFLCPCHGSNFDKDGRVVSGPAPKQLAWHELSLSADGRIVIDTSKMVKPGFALWA